MKEVDLLQEAERIKAEKVWSIFRSRFSFLRIHHGENNVRIFTIAYSYYVHWYTTENGAWKKQMCDNDDKGEGECRFCNPETAKHLNIKDNRRQERFACWVIDRSDNDKVKLFEMGIMVFRKIALAFSAEKVPTEKISIEDFDFCIRKDGEKMGIRYDVRCCGNQKEPDLIEKAREQIKDVPFEAIMGDEKARVDFIGDMEQEQRVLDRNW